MGFAPGTSVFLYGSRTKGKVRLVIATTTVEGDANPSDGVYVDISPVQARRMLGKLAECLADVDPKDPS